MEEGGLRSSAPYASSAEIAEQENERGLGELHNRVNILKRGNARNREEAAGTRGVPGMVAFAIGAAVGAVVGGVAVFLRTQGAGAQERAPPPPPPGPLPPPPPPPIGSGVTNAGLLGLGTVLGAGVVVGLLGLGSSVVAASNVIGNIGGPLGTVRVGHVEDMRPREIGEGLFGRGRIGDVLSSVRIGSSPSSPPV